jgi:hypothetical protein
MTSAHVAMQKILSRAAQVGLLCALLAGECSAQWGNPLRLIAPDGANYDQFGFSTAISGDTIVVGAPFRNEGFHYEQGAAYVYRWTGSGWSYEATLRTPDAPSNDEFGISVAIDGDTIVVGAVFDDVGAQDQGSAHVFVRSGTAWSHQARLVAPDGAAFDCFGQSVALSGDTALIGAHLDDETYAYQGSAHIFTRTGTSWTHEAKLVASDGRYNDEFGCSVSLDGATALVGARYADIAGGTNQGAAYVFTRSGGTWLQQARLVAPDAEDSDEFGESVALDGETALIGSRYDDLSGSDQGSAYVFTRHGETGSPHAKLVASDGAASDEFGCSVALNGATALVGARYGDVAGGTNQGAAYVFTRSGGAWSRAATLAAPDGQSDDWFGFSVALRGDTAVVGANVDDIGAIAGQGSAWVFSKVGPDCPGWREGGEFATLNGGVYALTVLDSGFGPQLYAGGEFTMAGGTTVNHVARWDGQAWHPLATGTDGTVHCLRAFGNELIVGGNFSSAGGEAANSIAAWNGHSWRALGSGVDAAVYALGEFRGELWAGGSFHSAGGNPALDLAIWNGTSWRIDDFAITAISPWPGVHAFGSFNGDLVAGGSFHAIDATSAHGLARWNGLAWDDFGVNIGNGAPNVHALAEFNGKLFAGGFDYFGAGHAGPLLRWVDDHSIGEPREPGVPQFMDVWALEVVNGILIVGGYVPEGQPYEALAGWDGAHWRFFDFGSAYHEVFAITKFNGDLVVGGRFSDAGGVPSPSIARYACPPCPADFNHDGTLTAIDLDLFVAAFEANEEIADFDRDGFLTGIDFDLYVVAFENGC